MVDRIDEFTFRGFIPEENRGGTYHVVLSLGGKLVGPMPPEAAAARGWSLPAICADINAQAIQELNDTKALVERVRVDLQAANVDAHNEKTRADGLEAQLVDARVAAEVSGVEKRSLLNIASFGMLDKG